MNHQDSGTIIVTFCFFLPWLGRVAVSTIAIWREHIDTQSRKAKQNCETDWRRFAAGPGCYPDTHTRLHLELFPDLRASARPRPDLPLAHSARPPISGENEASSEKSSES